MKKLMPDHCYHQWLPVVEDGILAGYTCSRCGAWIGQVSVSNLTDTAWKLLHYIAMQGATDDPQDVPSIWDSPGARQALVTLGFAKIIPAVPDAPVPDPWRTPSRERIAATPLGVAAWELLARKLAAPLPSFRLFGA